MKKIYVFSNFNGYKRIWKVYYWLEIVAETILEAKDRIKKEFPNDVKFVRIKEVL